MDSETSERRNERQMQDTTADGNSRDWREVSPNPVSRANINHRARELSAASRNETRSRFAIIVDLSRDQEVLDVGCVGEFKALGKTHTDSSRANRPRPPWLHGRIAEVASRCVGVDTDAVGVAGMNDAGYVALCADIMDDVTALSEHSPFDVVVAGEMIEHLGNPQGLLEAAAAVLKPGGALVFTTPNPFAPWRAYAGMRGQTWENVDHVVMLFPSGIAELAHRSGLRLEVATTVGGGF